MALAVIVTVHLGLGLANNYVTSVFEDPDEPNHFLYIRHWQAHGTLPMQDLERDAVRAHHPPGYFWLAAGLTAWDAASASGDFDSLGLVLNPRYRFRFGDPEPDHKSVFLHHTPAERWPYQGLPLTVHVARLLSLAFSTLAVVLTYAAARRLRPTDHILPWLAAGLIAFNPMVAFMAGVVQNDTAALAAGAAIVVLLSRVLRRGFQVKDWLLLEATLGLGILLKAGLLALGAVVALALLYAAWCTNRGWSTGLRRQQLRWLVANGAAVAAPVMVIAGWWLVRSQQLYGEWSGNSVVAAMWCCDPILYVRALQIFLTGLVGRFGQGLMITYPQPVYLGAGVLALVALAGHLRPDLASTRLGLAGPLPLPGVLTGRLAGGGRVRLAWPTPEGMLWLTHGITIVAVAGALLYYALTMAPGLPGRYMFPAFPSLALVLSAGWLAWFRPRRHALGVIFLAGLTGAAALYALFGMLIPTYSMPRSPGPAAMSTMTPVDAQIEETARVLGYRLSTITAEAGETVTVYWQPLSRTDFPYTVFLHLLSPGAGSLTQRDTFPGLGNYATTVWDVGRVFVDTYTLTLPPEGAGAGQAQIVFGLYHGETGVRLPVSGADAGTAEEAWVRLGRVEVR